MTSGARLEIGVDMLTSPVTTGVMDGMVSGVMSSPVRRVDLDSSHPSGIAGDELRHDWLAHGGLADEWLAHHRGRVDRSARVNPDPVQLQGC